MDLVTKQFHVITSTLKGGYVLSLANGVYITGNGKCPITPEKLNILDRGNINNAPIIDNKNVATTNFTWLPSSATTSSPFVQSWLDEFASGFDKGLWRQHFETVNRDGSSNSSCSFGLFEEGLKRSIGCRASGGGGKTQKGSKVTE